jgi:His/Glu/Gln/Arg/opine family amino acid ABC transporter permease subunit
MLAVTYDVGSYISENRELLLRGFGRTLLVSAIAILGALLIGAVLGAARAHRIPVVSQFAAAYVEVIRNTPILVQIFFLYYALPQAIGPWPGVRLDVFTVAWVSVMIWGGAYNTENFRAGFQAVPFQLREAGLALGFSRLRTFANVTLPIGGRIALPSSINTYIAVLKNTALLYVVSYPELTTTAIQIANVTLETLEAFTVIGVVYLTLVWTLSALIRLLESHLALPEDR